MRASERGRKEERGKIISEYLEEKRRRTFSSEVKGKNGKGSDGTRERGEKGVLATSWGEATGLINPFQQKPGGGGGFSGGGVLP